MNVGVIDIGIGNIGSLRNALYSQGWDSVSITSPEGFDDVSHLFLPGVGAFSAAMSELERFGLVGAIRAFAQSGRPILGICLGMQILADSGTEGGNVKGLGLISGNVVPIERTPGLFLPHVGWNEVCQTKSHPILQGIRDKVDFYFVHSYRFLPASVETILADTEYGEVFPSIVGRENIVGAQFHPEKSQANGLKLLDNFCLWDGKC